MPDHRYEIFALRYATLHNRKPFENFVVVDDHDAPASPLDFYVFVIRGEGRLFVVDTGFDPESGQRRGRAILRTPADALLSFGIDPAEVDDVVLTHMHWDHAGGMKYFPRARFHIQDAEMAFCTGRCMCHSAMRRTFDVEHVVHAVRALYAERMVFYSGTEELAPGIVLHLIGGHTGGIQALQVATGRGRVMVAGDTTHLWANIRERNPFPIVAETTRMLDGYLTLERLADGPDHIIPGHEPLLFKRFPPYKGNPEIVQLHLDPIA